MQDNYAVSGRFLTSCGGDRRLRPHNHPNHQALKCPRCESLNTKFCYYNNYNLSQPRHFCKGCHRYWTKGGVLRSVPVGGGCRKTKRSKSKCSDPDAPIRERKSKSQSSSSTDSSSLTASAVEIGSQTVTTTTTTYSAVGRNPNSDNNQPLSNHSSMTNCQMFTSLMTSSEKAVPEDVLTASYDRIRVREPQLAPVAENPGFAVVGTTKVDELKMNDDWWIDGAGGDDDDQVMFDLTAAIDPGYWSLPQWNDHDSSINYHP